MTDRAKEQEIYSGGGAPFPSLGDLFSGKIILWIATSALILLFGSAARGEIFLFAVMLWKNWDQFHFLPKPEVPTTSNETITLTTSNESERNISSPPVSELNEYLKDFCLQDFYIHIPAAIVVSYAIFLGVGGFLQWHYYIKMRDRSKEWKCQPERFLTPENERHEILLGSACLLLSSTVSGIVSTYVINGGTKARVYFDVNERGWIYFFASGVVYFLAADALSYYYHRMLHLPFFYRNFHKWHHRYHSPTAFSAVAMHPVESLGFQLLLLLPIFVISIHFIPVVGCFYYLYYFGLIDHSGIDMKSVWPWQPPVRFHDDHHKYFHVNFGFNTMIFDRFHGTLRRMDRNYGEDIYYGRGAPLRKSE